MLPVPGGPYSKIPFQGENGPLKKIGYLRGYTTASLIAVLHSSSPTISSQCTFNLFNMISCDKKYKNEKKKNNLSIGCYLICRLSSDYWSDTSQYNFLHVIYYYCNTN